MNIEQPSILTEEKIVNVMDSIKEQMKIIQKHIIMVGEEGFQNVEKTELIFKDDKGKEYKGGIYDEQRLDEYGLNEVIRQYRVFLDSGDRKVIFEVHSNKEEDGVDDPDYQIKEVVGTAEELREIFKDIEGYYNKQKEKI